MKKNKGNLQEQARNPYRNLSEEGKKRIKNVNGIKKCIWKK